MNKLIKYLVAFFLLLPALSWADGDITACRIKGTAPGDGWVLQVDVDATHSAISTGGAYDLGLGTNNNPSTAKITLTVTSLGYDNTGAATTISRTVYGTAALRKPYPDQATNNESVASGTLTLEIALSDFIYAKDKSGSGNSGTDIAISISAGMYSQGGVSTTSYSGTVTNNSTVAYPKVIGHFALEQSRPVNSVTPVEVFAVHKYGQNLKPVAAVIITATGATSTHTETATVTSMTQSARGDLIPVYQAALDLTTAAGFTRGELVNINFTAYPWVGDSGATLDATTDAGDAVYKLGPLKWTIMDKMIAVVDPANGNDTTGVASETQGTADASPCLTINGALTKIAAANNAAYSLNRIDGGEVQLKAGTYGWNKTGSQSSTNGYFTLTPHSSTNQAGVLIDTGSTHAAYTYQRFLNVTINRVADAFIIFGSNTIVVMEKVNFTDTYSGWYSASTNADLEFMDCTTTNSNLSKGGNDGHSRLNRNCTYTSPTGGELIVGQTSCVLGLKVTGGSKSIFEGLSGGHNNIIIGYSKALAKTDGYLISASSSSNFTNVAIVNNLMERIGSSATPIAEISNGNYSNILFLHNTFAGQRVNHENDVSSPYTNVTFLDWVGRNNFFNARGDHRADIIDTDASMVGTWSVGYSVGWLGNWNEAVSYTGDTDFWGLYSNVDTGSNSGTAIVPTSPVGYMADNSRSGADTGNGNYHLYSGSKGVNLIPPSKSVLPYDLDGNRRRSEADDAGCYTRGLGKMF